MAATGLLTLIDDIATLLDDVAVLSKVATQKTAGVLGDDLALNAEQVAGVRADREIPVVLAVAKGSFVNKFILVPAALAISAFIPMLILPLLMVGGLFLCFEGFEKVLHKLTHKPALGDDVEHHNKLLAIADPSVDMVAFEKAKIKGAIRTDFILSAEIIVIVLGTVKDESLGIQAMVVSTVALLVTFVVYGLVGIIVKLDDSGRYLMEHNEDGMLRRLGKGLLLFAPKLMKSLGILGTAAMFLVGGGIVMHGLPFVHHTFEVVDEALGKNFHLLTELMFSGLCGIMSGAVVYLAVTTIKRIRNGMSR